MYSVEEEKELHYIYSQDKNNKKIKKWHSGQVWLAC